jgi:hypothetical protein
VQANYGSNWTGLFCTGSQILLPQELRQQTYIWQNSDGYDGQFYRLIAHDPLLQRGYARFVDDPRLRYRRILLPALAAITGWGIYTDQAYVFWVLVFSAAGVYFTARWFARHGRRPVWGLLFLVSPAAIASVDRMLLDGAALALLVAALLYFEEGRYGRLYVVCFAATLVRETAWIVPAAALVHFAVGREWRKVGAFSTAFVPGVAWWLFIAARTPPSAALPGVFGIPLVGYVERAFSVRPATGDPITDTILRTADVVAALAMLTVVVLGMREVFRWPSVGGKATVLGYVLVLACATAPTYLFDFYGYARPGSSLVLAVSMAGVVRGVWVQLAPQFLLAGAVSLFLLWEVVGVIRYLGWLI